MERLNNAFNARNLSYEQVADTFVSNGQFENLIDSNHTLLMGPRGSGKTTLLKMLTPMALDKWFAREVKSPKNKIPFNGIYIPTDTQFKRQLDFIKSNLDTNNYMLISKALVTTNILVALLKTFDYISDQDIQKEREVAIKLIDVWDLPKPMATDIHSIEEALLRRVTDLDELSNKIIHNLNGGKVDIVYPNYLFKSFLPLCEYACAVYEKVYSVSTEVKWALCFDELELAPEWLQEELLDLLRSANQRFIFKLTTTPIIKFSEQTNISKNVDSATPYNDYRIVRTWPVNNMEMKKWNKFCEEITINKLKRKFNSRIVPEEIFGNDDLERSAESNLQDGVKVYDEYGRNSQNWYIIKEYAEINKNFKDFLIGKKIDPFDPVPSSQKERDEVFRKLKEIIIYKNSFFSNNRKRSRKNVVLYYGVPYLYEICDGNPRQLISLLDGLISRMVSIDKPVALNVNAQSEIVVNHSIRYLKLISTHPEASVMHGQKTINAAKILENIGNYFHENLIKDDNFSLDPVGSFVVDKADSQTIELLKFALNYGAIVYVNPVEGVSNIGIVGKRFRLSYLLTPVFKIPKRSYRQVNLSTIMNYKFEFEQTQLSIF